MTAADLDVHLPDIQAGDDVAFGRWLSGAEPSVRLSLRSFAAHVDTEAVLQETLLRVWQVAHRFAPDGRPNGLLRLAHRIARNAAISERRRLGGGASGVTSMDPEQAERLAEVTAASPPDPHLRRALAECREKLPEKPGLALDARLASFGEGPDEALAAALSMRTNTFLQNVTRARKLLAECLRKRGVDLAVELR